MLAVEPTGPVAAPLVWLPMLSFEAHNPRTHIKLLRAFFTGPAVAPRASDSTNANALH
ncbi:hypothetical protein P7K49_029524, partial [Saguinus oedipus]